MSARKLLRTGTSALGRLRGAIRLGGVMCLTVCLACGAVWFGLRLVALPPALLTPPAPVLQIVDRRGESLRTARGGEEPYGSRIEYHEIPKALIDATLAAEDKRFWRHPGIDGRGTCRAFWQLARYRRVVSGGSTITQQLIKLAQPRPRTIRTKIIESVQALRLEQVWTKRRILTEYLNRLDYGNFNRGCATAAHFYFAKPLRDLSPAECALLAALPQAPSRLNPHRHLDRAIKRQQWVLGQMHRCGWLGEKELERAMQEPLHLGRAKRVFEAPHFVDLLLRSLPDDCTSGVRQGRPIRTTLDLGLNRFAEMALRDQLLKLRSHHARNGAVVILDNHTREVLALVGSENYFAAGAGQVNGAWAARSAGSTFKPFTYLIALEGGATPATVIADVPTEFPTSTGLFAPANYDRQCYGPVRYRLALANSLNISAVKVLESVGGPAPLLERLRACGLSTLTRTADHYGLGLTIGNAEARLLELANAYACLASLGEYRPWQLLRTNLLAPATRVAQRQAAYLIGDMLNDNAARALAFGIESPLRFDFPVACKTGTSSDFRDNWAFGYTPEFTVGVWIGNFDGTAMQQVSGVSGAAPILHELFVHLHERYGTTWYDMPEDIVEAWIHPFTGKRLVNSREAKASPVREKFIRWVLPEYESEQDYAGPMIRLGGEYRQWLTSPGNWLAGRAVIDENAGALRIVWPLPGTVFYLDADLREQGRRLSLRVDRSEKVDWHSPSLKLVTGSVRPTALLIEGKHRLWARDRATGAEAHTWIEVLRR